MVKLGGAVLVQGAGAVFCAGVSFALTLWLARVLGTAGFGAYVALLSLATLALMLQEGGWPAWLYRERARAGGGAEAEAEAGAESGNAVSRAIMARYLVHVGAVTLLLCAVAGWFSGWDVVMALVAMAFVAVMNGVSVGLRGAGWFAHDAAWQSWGRVVSAGAVAAVLAVVLAGVSGWGAVSLSESSVAVSSSASLAAVFGAWAAGLALVVLAGGWRQGAVVVWPVAPVWAGWRVYQNDLGRVWPFAFMAAAGAWLLKGDVVILAWWGAGSVGAVAVDAVALSWYAACTRLIEAALLLFAPVANVLLRSFSDELGAGGALVLRGRVARWCGLLGGLGVMGQFAASIRGMSAACTALDFPVVSGNVSLYNETEGRPILPTPAIGGLGVLGVALAWAVGPGLMALLFGEPYAEAGLLLPWVVAMLPFAWANLVLAHWLAALGRERGLALGMLLAGAVLLLALWWWVPVWGVQGAAAAMVLSHAVLSAWGWWLGGRSA